MNGERLTKKEHLAILDEFDKNNIRYYGSG